MAYGKIKSDALIYDNSGSDAEITISTIPTAAQVAAKADASAVTANTTAIAGKAGLTSAQTFTALQTLNAGLAVDGPYKQTAEAVAALTIDLSAGNYFTKTINADSTFIFSNPPASGTAGSFTLELTHTSGAVTWPGTVKFPADTAPTLTAGKTHLFIFVTDDGGARYRGASLVDYVN